MRVPVGSAIAAPASGACASGTPGAVAVSSVAVASDHTGGLLLLLLLAAMPGAGSADDGGSNEAVGVVCSVFHSEWIGLYGVMSRPLQHQRRRAAHYRLARSTPRP
jgi:hypothetical protein